MTTPVRARYVGYWFPAEIIGHAVWLYFRVPLGLRMVEFGTGRSRGSAARQVEWLPRVEGEEVRFASDSALEEKGFELSVPPGASQCRHHRARLTAPACPCLPRR
jgi:hypothetical protein